LPEAWREDYRTATVNGAWWAGRRVPEFARARKFLRENALALGLLDKETMGEWLGGSFVWFSAVSFGKPDGLRLRVVRGEDGERLFFNSPGTEFYWWSELLYTADARQAALEKFGEPGAGPLSVPPPPVENPETFSASPVSPPDDFSLGDGEEETSGKSRGGGGLIFNPLPRPRE
jgi:hypothetical protein